MSARKKVLQRIEAFWEEAQTPAKKLRWSNARNLLMHIGRIDVPNKIVSPNNDYFAGTQFYWDTYFTVIGLLEAGKTELAKGMVDNLVYLYKKFGFVPARNSLTSIGRSQPPFLTRMAWEVYTVDRDDAWLDEVMEIAQKEYLHTWNNEQRFDDTTGLSRYRPWTLQKLLTTYESGWDVSSRFALGRTEVIPVDLNCLLYRYEKDIEAWCKLRKKPKEATTWSRRAEQRRRNIIEYCWDGSEGFFFDYDSEKKETDTLFTLAGFFPMWAGLATPMQARKCVKNLDRFKQSYGISTTQEDKWQRRQWDHPNSWPPLQLILVEALQKYGFKTEAQAATKQWLTLVEDVYKDTGELWEKYDVVGSREGVSGRYPTQSGFAWTCGVYLRLMRHVKQDRN